MKKLARKEEPQAEKKPRRKPEQSAKGKKPRADQPASPALHDQSMEAQAVTLRHLPAAQRQDVVRQISQVSGNRYVDRLVKTMDQDSAIQPKLKVSTPGDQYEQEAEQVSKRVMTMPAPTQQADEEVAQTKPLAQRQGEEDQEQVQAKSNQRGELEADSAVEDKLVSTKGGGQPLPGETQDMMGSRFGSDFSEVRIHADTQGAELSQDLKAQAFTHGQDIYFAPDKYDPGSSAGKQLLAHELTHVVQQGGAPAQQPAEGQETASARPAQRQGEEEIQTKAATVGAPATQAATKPRQAQESLRPYQVKLGEGLQILARKLGVTIETLKALNKQKLRRWGNAEGFQAGEVIMVPASAHIPQNTQTVAPKTQTITPEIAIAYGPNADKSTVTEYTLKVLKDLLGAAGEKKALITATTRDPARQAAAMVEEIKRQGLSSQRALYDQPGNMVIDEFVKLQAQGTPAQQILAAMATKIKEVGAMDVSAHCQDPKVLQAIDIDPNSINNPAEFFKALVAAKEAGLIAKFILPPIYPAYHIEISQGTKIF